MIKSRVAMACIASLVVAALHPASAQMFADKSVTLSSGSVTPILAPMQYPKIRSYYVVQNVGQTGVAWCSDSDPAPAPYKPDSFPLTAYGAPYGMATKRSSSAPWMRISSRKTVCGARPMPAPCPSPSKS
jgi:hypothetical protein